MADEKQPTSDPGPADPGPSGLAENAAKDDPPAGSPWRAPASGEAASGNTATAAGDGGADGAVGDITAPDAAIPGKRRGAWGAGAALIVLALLAVGLYLSWPILQPRLLALLPAAATQSLAAVKALDHRVAQLEAANARLDQAVESIKSTMDRFTGQLDDLAKGVSDGEILAALRGKLATMEAAMAQLGQQAGASGAAALAALNAEVDALKAQLGVLANAVVRTDTGGNDTAAPVPGASQEQLTALAQQTAALADDNKTLRQTMAALQTRLEQLERTAQHSARAGQKSGAGQGLVLAVGQLRQTVLSGAPYAAALAAVTALAGDDTALQAAARTLAPWAGAGIATLRALSDQFPAMARAVLRADPNAADGFWRRTLHRVSSMVTVRRVGEVDGMEADAILARAERRLAAGELAAAAALIDGLEGPAAAAARDWLDRATARLAALAALADLQSRAIAALADG